MQSWKADLQRTVKPLDLSKILQKTLGENVNTTNSNWLDVVRAVMRHH